MFDFSILFTGFLGDVVTSLIIFLLSVFSAGWIIKLLDRVVQRSHRTFDATHYIFFKHLLRAWVYLMGLSIAVYNIPQLRALSISILAGAGVLAVVFGFASQQAFSNIISGVFIAVFKPIRVNDRIKIDGEIMGVVEDITLRHTILRTFENKMIIIPNSVLSDKIIENSNLGDEKICRFIEFGISYDSNIDQAISIIKDEAERHRFFLDNRSEAEKNEGEPKVQVRVIGFGDSSVNLRGYVWAADPKSGFIMGCDLNKSIKERFDREGVEIPFPYRTIVYKKDLGGGK